MNVSSIKDDGGDGLGPGEEEQKTARGDPLTYTERLEGMSEVVTAKNMQKRFLLSKKTMSFKK